MGYSILEYTDYELYIVYWDIQTMKYSILGYTDYVL